MMLFGEIYKLRDITLLHCETA